MISPYTPQDQVLGFVIHASTCPAILVNEETFKDLYIQRVEDHSVPSYDQSTRSSYQCTMAKPQVPSTGMSAFDNPTETPIGTFNKEMNHDNDEATGVLSGGPEPSNALRRFRGKADLLPNTINKASLN